MRFDDALGKKKRTGYTPVPLSGVHSDECRRRRGPMMTPGE